MESTCAVDHGPRLVEVGELTVDLYPVTNGEYVRFLSESGYRPEQTESFLRHWEKGKVPSGREAHPVVWVSPEDAQAYASWAGGRLPSDEEWQYIAAGPEGRTWPWGEKFDAMRCNHDGHELCEVTAYPAGVSWCGVYDLSGNAWEWTSSIIDDGMHRFALIKAS
jgi:formylglycine-generating enzyme required for sulfatase activity